MKLLRCAMVFVMLLVTVSAWGAEPTFCDVFVPSRDGFKSIRIPSVILTRKGALLAFAEGRSANRDQASNKIIAKRSTDGGQTWDAARVLADDGANSLNNPT